MIPAVLAALRQTPETNALINTFVESIDDALLRRFFGFSNCTAAFFFAPGTENFTELYNIVAYVFEQNIVRDLIDVTNLTPEDIKVMPLWAGPDVQPFAEQYIRSAAVHQSAFVNSIAARITSTEAVKRLLEKSHRPNAIVELRSILMAFGSLNLLIKALKSDATHPITQAYLHRVVQTFAAEPTIPDGLYCNFKGAVNVAAECGVPDQPFYTPVRPASGNAHATLAKLLVAAHRTSCCIPGFTNDILSTTNFVVSFLYSSYDSIWTASRTATLARAPAPPVPAAPAVRADIVEPPTPRMGAPKTPSGRRAITPTEASRTFRPPSAEAMLKAMNGFSARITSPSATF
jgi:hypothetical protein